MTEAPAGVQGLGPPSCQGPRNVQRYLYLWMILGHVDKCWEALAEPHGHVAVHVDSKRLKALLEAAHGIKLEGAGVHPEIHAADLRQAQRAYGHKACRMVREPGQPSGLSWEAGRKRNLCFLNSFESQQERQKDGTVSFSFFLHINSTTGGHMEFAAALGIWERKVSLVQNDLLKKTII